MTSAGHWALGIVLGGAALLGSGANATASATRPANHKGLVFVAEYHHIGPGGTNYDRSPTAFRSDLERLDRMGFRPVTARAWLSGRMSLPKGTSPVVMTFDDSQPDQFRLLDDGTVDPRCGVGLWLAFAKAHPEFPVRATFFVLPVMWGQPKWVGTKLRRLRGWGSEVANHTVSHVPLRAQTDARVEREIGGGAIRLAKLGEKGPFDLAYPYGSTPRHLKLMKGLRYKGRRIVVASAFIAGANPSPMPGAKRFSRYRIPRVQAIKGRYGLDFWLDRVAKGKVKPYVQ